ALGHAVCAALPALVTAGASKRAPEEDGDARGAQSTTLRRRRRIVAAAEMTPSQMLRRPVRWAADLARRSGSRRPRRVTDSRRPAPSVALRRGA
ncbi:MAG: hypothetical protein ACHQ4H_18455, partial [Ktedonobacterales bacterium]